MMQWISFLIHSVLFGIGLAMDAFSVSMANGLAEPAMPRKKALKIAGTFGFFQILMPLLGWFLVRTVAETFTAFQRWIPWIALLLLLYIGGKMLIEGIRAKKKPEAAAAAVGGKELFVQGIATSIDALSVGFTIADLAAPMAMLEAGIIGVVTFFICMGGLRIGKALGTKLSGKASILGGIILIGIGIEIFVTGVF